MVPANIETKIDWTSKFLAHGLIQQWKLMQDIQLSGLVRSVRKLEYSAANITEQSQLNDELIRNEHLWGVYSIIGVCNLAGFLALLAELLIPQGEEVFMMNLTTYAYLYFIGKYVIDALLLTFVHSLVHCAFARDDFGIL
jgi:hypothetical protein